MVGLERGAPCARFWCFPVFGKLSSRWSSFRVGFCDDFVSVDVEEVVGVGGFHEYGGIGASSGSGHGDDLLVHGYGAGVCGHDRDLKAHLHALAEESQHLGYELSDGWDVGRCWSRWGSRFARSSRGSDGQASGDAPEGVGAGHDLRSQLFKLTPVLISEFDSSRFVESGLMGDDDHLDVCVFEGFRRFHPGLPSG